MILRKKNKIHNLFKNPLRFSHPLYNGFLFLYNKFCKTAGKDHSVRPKILPAPWMLFIFFLWQHCIFKTSVIFPISGR